MQYIYKTTLFTETTNVIGSPSSNASDLADFVANYAGEVTPVDDVVIQSDYAEVDISYTEFKANVAQWGDVLAIDKDNVVTLYLLKNTPI